MFLKHFLHSEFSVDELAATTSLHFKDHLSRVQRMHQRKKCDVHCVLLNFFKCSKFPFDWQKKKKKRTKKKKKEPNNFEVSPLAFFLWLCADTEIRLSPTSWFLCRVSSETAAKITTTYCATFWKKVAFSKHTKLKYRYISNKNVKKSCHVP